MTYETIRYAAEDGIAILTLARPERLNAINGTLLAEFIAVCDRVDADDAVRVLIVTGAGRAFSAGADLSRGVDSFVDPKSAAFVRADGTIDYGHPQARDGGGIATLRLFNLLKPVIGAINGAAVGLGVTLTLAMDVRIASEDAKFGFVFNRRGMIPEAASAFFLPRLVGISRALEWCYAARMVSAQEAFAAGLVRSVVPAGELMPAAQALARTFADNSAPVSAAITRQMMWRGLGAAHPMEAHRIDSRGIASRSRSRDVAEGVGAWMEKRDPAFPDTVSRDMPDDFPWWEEPEFS